MNRRVFITGTESFVGRNLIKRCDELGYEVSGCDSNKPADQRFYEYDIRSLEINRVIPYGVDVIVHLAALSTDKLCRDNATECFDINVMGTLNLIEAAKIRRCKQFIFSSTEWVYGEFGAGEEKTEDSTIDISKLTSEYALSKLVSENNLRQANQNGPLDVTILRFGIIYGSRKQNWSAVESLFSSAQEYGKVNIGSSKTGRCFVHVSDICEGIIRSIGLTGFNLINLQGGKLVTLGEIIRLSEKVIGRRVSVKVADESQFNVRQVSRVKATELLNWDPNVDMEKGLRNLCEYFRNK